MNLSTIIDRLQFLTGQKIKQADIARALNVDPGAITTRIKRGTDLRETEIQKISIYFRVDFKELYSNSVLFDDDDSFAADYYPDVMASCGTGVLEQSQNKTQIRVPKAILFEKFSQNSRYSVINARGNSMEPTIYDKDKLIIQEENFSQIIDNAVYLFCYKDEFYIKRLCKNINQVMIKSDNNDYEEIKLGENQLEDLRVVGRVVGLIRYML